ncbi:beta-glucosidase BglX [Tamlana fucoidanivorans]|uniref:beta-glucosidase n=1 Tax=Allotamlana fucoidanivorans TaxID=2583814 RepID=A0A5C4SJR0_9FLAO|nr:beta-glucosidase BglX [Tamlana fucoidanivorans]TNJ44146.1 beta-glucosidase BglX [Tamlana fucoidanivorans]
MRLLHVCLGLVLPFFAISQSDYKPTTPLQSPIDKKVDSLLTLMTLEEKVGQMNQYNGFWEVTGPAPTEGNAAKKYEHLRQGLVGSMLNVRGVKNVYEVQKIAVEETRLGIPLIIGFDVIHGYKTISPIPLAESASWDLEAIKKSSSVAADESAAAGINWTFAPMVDISRDARWGRVMEGAGEDAFLGSKIAQARVQGFQGDKLSANTTIAACAKHFAAYGFPEAGRDYNTVDIGTSTLYNQVFPPFKAAADSDVKTFMNAFNILNGIPATGNAFLQRDILKGKWGFEGFVISDWGSLKEMISHGFAKDLKQVAEIAVKAGSDMDMESYAYVNELVKLVKDGVVNEALVDDAVKRILKVKFELGLFDDPYRYCSYEREQTIGKPEHHEAVLDMAKKSIVLLKNENKQLPLKKEGLKIALIGSLANDKDSPIGSWRAAAEPNSAVSVLEGLKKHSANTIIYSEGVKVLTSNPGFTGKANISYDKSGFADAIATAKKADVVVMVLGEHGFQSGEGRSRANINLPGVQQELLEAVYEINKNIVLILNNGRPLAIPWAAQHIPSIVEAWHLGSQSGNAIAQVVFGDYNPSGKLTMSFPRSVGQVPIMYNRYNTGRPANAEDNVFWSHYSDEENSPQFVFGHGLSYSEFSYEDLNVTVNADSTLSVSVKVTNTSSIDGKEVVQLYIHDKVASVVRPIKELKGFELVAFEAGETKTIRFTLTEQELGFFNNLGQWRFEPGDFKIFIGGSSNTVLETEVTIK